jgi:hypothetical protein
MLIRYSPCPVRTPVPALGGATFVPRPILAVLITGPSGSRLRDGLLDTGSDETIVDPFSGSANRCGFELGFRARNQPHRSRPDSVPLCSGAATH